MTAIFCFKLESTLLLLLAISTRGYICEVIFNLGRKPVVVFPKSEVVVFPKSEVVVFPKSEVVVFPKSEVVVFPKSEVVVFPKFEVVVFPKSEVVVFVERISVHSHSENLGLNQSGHISKVVDLLKWLFSGVLLQKLTQLNGVNDTICNSWCAYRPTWGGGGG